MERRAGTLATIRFCWAGGAKRVDVEVPTAIHPGPRPTLLAIARAHGIPIPFGCEGGACGACQVRVETISMGSTRLAGLTAAEQLVLSAAERASALTAVPGCSGTSARMRLACQYRPGDEGIAVAFATDLGSI
ncbi:MAG: 2Fe-2S iron-sulfur cluster-binding protein [Rhodospirillales bacterium]